MSAMATRPARPSVVPVMLIAGGLALALLAGCHGGPPRATDIPPSLAPVMHGLHDIYDLAHDDGLDEAEKGRRIDLRYDEAHTEWRATPYYGRSVSFEIAEQFYRAVATHFEGRNELGRSLRIRADAAAEARAAGEVSSYLKHQEQVLDALVATGQRDRARLHLEVVAEELADLVFRDSIDAMAYSEEVHERFYYLTYQDLALRIALLAPDRLDGAYWRGELERRRRWVGEDPELAYMDIWTTGATLASYREEDNRYSPVVWPLYRLALALAQAPGVDERENVERLLEKIQASFAHRESRIEARQREAVLAAEREADARWGSLALGATPSYRRERRLDASRDGTRAGYSLHAVEARLAFELGEYPRAAEAAARATEAISAVDALYARLPSRYRVVDRIDADHGELRLLQARIDERRGRLDEALEGYDAFVAWAERSREALPLDQRQHFFESVASAAYLGRVRVLAAMYTAAPGDEAMAAVLDATEAFRSRQLREMLGTATEGVASLPEVQRTLGPGDAVLAISDLDTALLSVVLTSSDHTLELVDKPAGWDQEIFRIRNALVDTLQFELSALDALVAPLLHPVADALADADGLYVLTDGALAALPASVLPMPDGSLLQGRRPLRYVPSLSMLGDDSRAPVRADRGRSLFALGDPVYDRDATVERHIGETLVSSTRSADTLGMFTPLPETRDEVNAIAALMDESLVLVGEDARESRVKQADLSRYRYLHFATHGVIGEDIPELGEPALILGYEDGEDGLLTASEVAALELDAELVVLSACNTGNGEYFRGEGLMGLGRVFMIAGSRQVLVSLWPVDSFATKALMLEFYGGLNSGLEPATALAEAQHTLMNTELGELPGELRSLQRVDRDDDWSDGYRNPFFWSPFVLIGS